MFLESLVDFEENLFERLSQSANFEDITNGRQGAILLDLQNDLIPIVRTTTMYQNSASRFSQIHHDIIDKIKINFNLHDLKFNNAMIEIYDDNYCTMGFHSDQALDLDNDSYICIFSCYDNPPLNNKGVRKLKIEKKESKTHTEVILRHNSIVLFSTSVNKQYLHKIILENKGHNRWLGITFRLSKTYIKLTEGIPYFYGSDRRLVLANEDEKKQFYKYRRLENSSINYEYPEINYTISNSDILTPQ